MARLAIFIDGGYISSLAEKEFGIWVNYELLPKKILEVIKNNTSEPVDLFRTYFYDCLPYQSNPPLKEEEERFAKTRKFFDYLSKLPRFTLRQGRLAFRGLDSKGKPIFQQKRVDLLLGLDIATLSAKQQISHIALIAGDSDFIPAFEIASSEGVSVWLFHGPKRSRADSKPTFAEELWRAADERCEIDAAFMKSVELVRR